MLNQTIVQELLQRAFQEDSPQGDISSSQVIPEDFIGEADLVARQEGVISGIDIFAQAFGYINPQVTVERFIADGRKFDSGERLARVCGPMRAILRSERVALNIVQHMTGIATATAAFVREVEGRNIAIKDTRKTLPGLRAVQRYAVTCGGGVNHRNGLSDAVMMKDNHLAVLRALGVPVSRAIAHARTIRIDGSPVVVEVEVDDPTQIEEVLSGHPDVIMLDNFSPEDTVAAVRQIDHRAEVEASGNMTLEKVRSIADSGIDTISIGSLTHSVKGIDLGLDWAD
ncbi:MAG: carboxylating nicotinate-nucleotide diphosphorylase [Bifidobacterium sp.]|uniref:Nicotinate-nucleotide pyrophosphorylase [carboxylating] n=1 Tax=Bifidobacterium fermentum TaxID=3059035 RepID=A0AB39UMX3_9BIFI